MKGLPLLLLVSLIIVTICEAKKKRKKFSEKQFGVRSGQSEERGCIFQFDPYKGKLFKSILSSKLFEFLGRLLSKSFFVNTYRSNRISSYLSFGNLMPKQKNNHPFESDEDCAKCFKEGYETGYKDAMSELQSNEFPAWKNSRNSSGVIQKPWPNFPFAPQNPNFPSPQNPNQNPSNPFPKYPVYPQFPFPNYPSIPPNSLPNLPAPQATIQNPQNPYPNYPPFPQFPANPPNSIPNYPFGPVDNKQTKQPSWRTPIISYPQTIPDSRILDMLFPKEGQRFTNPSYPIFNYQEIYRFSPLDIWEWVRQMNQMSPSHNQHE